MRLDRFNPANIRVRDAGGGGGFPGGGGGKLGCGGLVIVLIGALVFGIDPGQTARDLEFAILRQDPALDLSAPPAATSVMAGPAQLPLAVASFTGRTRELEALNGLVSGVPAMPRQHQALR